MFSKEQVQWVDSATKSIALIDHFNSNLFIWYYGTLYLESNSTRTASDKSGVRDYFRRKIVQERAAGQIRHPSNSCSGLG